MEKNKIKSAIEAILFSFGESVEIDKIAKALELDKEIAQEYVHELMQDYEQDERGSRVIELENC